jgi:hypothetical protein
MGKSLSREKNKKSDHQKSQRPRRVPSSLPTWSGKGTRRRQSIRLTESFAKTTLAADSRCMNVGSGTIPISSSFLFSFQRPNRHVKERTKERRKERKKKGTTIWDPDKARG